jgi:hypothetical protein
MSFTLDESFDVLLKTHSDGWMMMLAVNRRAIAMTMPCVCVCRYVIIAATTSGQTKEHNLAICV